MLACNNYSYFKGRFLTESHCAYIRNCIIFCACFNTHSHVFIRCVKDNSTHLYDRSIEVWALLFLVNAFFSNYCIWRGPWRCDLTINSAAIWWKWCLKDSLCWDEFISFLSKSKSIDRENNFHIKIANFCFIS